MWFNFHIFYDAETASSSPDATPSETLEDPYEETIPDPVESDPVNSKDTQSDQTESPEPSPPPPSRVVPDYTFDDVGTAENVIGIRDPELYSGATDNLSTGSRVNLTTAIFDTSSRADSARIWLKNESGSTVYVRGVSIRGKLVYKNSPPESGNVNEEYKDHDNIRESGERRFTIKNDYLVTKDQVDKVADYYWKFFGGDDPTNAKHIYTLRLHGVYAWFEVGNRYRVTIGGAGQAENIDSHCELQSVSTVINAKGIGKTTLVLRQMQLLWTSTSSATLRSFSYGRRSQYSTNNGTVLVAPSTAFVTADYYCDGTADNVQIQLAIDYLSTTFGGGTVNLLSGTYNIASYLDLRTGVVVKGQGMENTVLSLTGVDWGLQASSTIDAGIENLSIDASNTRTGSPPSNNSTAVILTSNQRFRMTAVTIKEANGGFIKGSTETELLIEKCVFKNGQRDLVAESWTPAFDVGSPASYISLNDSASFLIINNEFYATSSPTTRNTNGVGYNIVYVTGSSGGRIRGNFFHDLTFNFNATSGGGMTSQLIWVEGYPAISAGGVLRNEINDVGTIIEQNQFLNCRNIWASMVAIIAEANEMKVADNVITNVTGNTAVGVLQTAIQIHHNNNSVSGNVLNNSDGGFEVVSGSVATDLGNNRATKVGQLVGQGTCESTTAPSIDGTASTANASYARDSAQKYTGSYSYKMTSSGSGIVYAYLHDNAGATDDLHGLFVGRQYTITAWVYIPSGVGITGTNFGITFQDYQGSWAWTTGSATNTYGSWQAITATRTIRSSATAVNIYFAWTASGSGEYLYVDDVRMYPDNDFNDHETDLKDSGTGTIY